MPMAFMLQSKKAAVKAPKKGDGFEFMLRTLVPFLGVFAALAISAVVLLLLKTNPIVAYSAMLQGAFGSISGLSQSLVKATPLLLVG
jgi:general nucleoside transport system permease protein